MGRTMKLMMMTTRWWRGEEVMELREGIEREEPKEDRGRKLVARRQAEERQGSQRAWGRHRH